MRRLVFGFLILLSSSLSADVIKMGSGNEFECVVVQENADSIVVRRGYGTMTIPRAQIASVTKSAVLTEASIAPTTRPGTAQPMSPWSEILTKLVRSNWASNVQQIPATVIDVGIMRHVPYQSYRCGDDYELNIYGDPDHPAAIEIGIYRTLLNDARAKQNCVDFMASILTDKADAAMLSMLNKTKDVATRDGLTAEVTPASDPDAYGGWWVSVYSEKELDAARATDAELKHITVGRDRPVATASRAAQLEPSTARPSRANNSTPDSMETWSPSDMARARPPAPSKTGGGSVYVRGYHPKDGTYVHAHTRRASR